MQPMGGNHHGNTIKSLRTFVKKTNGTSEPFVLHGNGYNSKIISSFISVISYIPLVLGFLLNRGDQDLQVHPEHMGGKVSEMVTLIFTISLDWRCNKKVRRLPLFPVIPLAQVLPVKKKLPFM